MLRILGIVTTALLMLNAENLNFFQNEYDITMDIARIAWFNNSVYKYFKADFVLYNRTQRVLNASWEQLVDLKSDVMVHVQVYKFMSNEYRIFPVFVTVNGCAEFSKNTFAVRSTLLKASNLDVCNLKKGVYNLYNGMPDVSKFPPHLPRGQYKLACSFAYHSYNLYDLEFYGKIKDKPIDWRKIPKHNWR